MLSIHLPWCWDIDVSIYVMLIILIYFSQFFFYLF